MESKNKDQEFYRKLWLSHNTVVEMLKERNYDTSHQVYEEIEDFVLNYTNLTSTNTQQLNFVSQRFINNGKSESERNVYNLNNERNERKGSYETIVVHFSLEEKLSKRSLEGIIQGYVNQNINKLILISLNKLNYACLSFCNTIKNSIIVEHFMQKELLFNPSKHILVPNHRIMNFEEVNDLLQKYSCNKTNLPIILKEDVMVKYLGAQTNDIIEILRDSKTTKVSKYYRIVK